MKALTPPRLLAAAAAACFVLPSCQRNTEAKADPQWWKLESERVEVAHQVELLELRLSKQKAGDQGFAALTAEVERGDAWRRELAAQRDEAREEVERAHESLEIAKNEWMRATRGAAVGREFAKFTGLRGRSYENAVITRVTDVGVEFRHATGTARLAAADLTPSQHEIFGLDAEIAGAAIRQEKETALAYDSWVDERVTAAAEVQKEEDDRRALAMASTPEPRATPSIAATSPETFSRSRLSERPRSFGSSGTTVWYSNYYSRPYYRSYSYVRPYRPSASIFYDPCTGGAPARVNTPQSYRTPSKNWTFKPRSAGSNAPVTSGYQSRPSFTTP
ncbi:hypothetical protein OKA05_28065 [Luteolibacter arcticus]|uniref:DUF4398 domain-containing protein n=1 Tax=Luteolibacter arcticus TaxID=1581411 RepID=A0ABT3GSI8_9BACT|nr:hypothetical protein [Luteolibacter arcticus]MCW1926439.1 hypothetical protein [Luteolibacter arcticus]